MKWNNKGHEKIGNDYYDLNSKRIYVYGAGEIGRGLHITLKKFDLFEGFIDNDKKKQEIGLNGEKVFSYDYLKDKKDYIIVIVAASRLNEIEICKQLDEDGIKYYKANFFLDRILPVFLWVSRNILMMNLSQICLTERCTLHCQKCAHACYAVDKNSSDMDLNEINDTADIFFSKIDYIHEFVLIGGEPLLYKDLDKVIEYIGKRYRNKIGIFSITTNGTLLPNESVLKESRQYELYFRISNYSKTIPALSKRYEELTTLLKNNDVNYYLGKIEEEWWDYNLGKVNGSLDEKTLISKFDSCATPCREVKNNKLYFCVMAHTASVNLKLFIGEDDYLDISKLPNGEIGKRILLEYNLGYSEKGYLSMCSRCRGAECYKYPIPVAEQK